MTAERSELFRTFLAGVEEVPARLGRDWVDEYPGIGALRLLTGDERVEAEDILIGKLATNDGRAATALADAGCTRAIPALVERTGDTTPPLMRVFAARALLRLGDHSGRAPLTAMVRHREGTGTDRSTAVRLLGEFPQPDEEFLVATAATDPDDGVRLSAVRALLGGYGLDAEETAYGEVLWSVAGRIMSPLAAVRDEAVAELRRILAAPAELDLTWRAERVGGPLAAFVESVTSEEATGEYPLDGLAALAGRERRLVENLLLLYLHRDGRAVRAAARLGIERAVAPLRELAGAPDQDMAAEARSALRALAGNP